MAVAVVYVYTCLLHNTARIFNYEKHFTSAATFLLYYLNNVFPSPIAAYAATTMTEFQIICETKG